MCVSVSLSWPPAQRHGGSMVCEHDVYCGAMVWRGGMVWGCGMGAWWGCGVGARYVVWECGVWCGSVLFGVW